MQEFDRLGSVAGDDDLVGDAVAIQGAEGQGLVVGIVLDEENGPVSGAFGGSFEPFIGRVGSTPRAGVGEAWKRSVIG